MRTNILVLTALAIAVVSCGGDDSADKSEPQQMCESFATTWCQRSVECFIAVGTFTEADRAEGERRCTDVAIAAAQCERAESVSSSHGQCLADIRVMDCALWNVPQEELSKIQMPQTCVGVIRISPP